MKFVATLLLLAGMAMVIVNAYRVPVQKPYPNKPFPTFPGQGPFNPKIRFPRSADSGRNGQINIHGQKEGGKISWNAEGRKDIWKNDHGSIWVSGGANKQPGYKPQGQVGIGGSFHWG